MAQPVKNPPAMQEMQEMWVQSLGWEDPLEEEMTTHSSILAWEIAWTEEPARPQSLGLQRFGHDWAHFFIIATVLILIIVFILNEAFYWPEKNTKMHIYLYNYVSYFQSHFNYN